MKYSINAQGVPEAFGPYSQGTTAGRLVFAAGQLPIAEGQTDVLVEGGITEQASRVIDLCERLVSEAGCSLSDVARTTVYLRTLLTWTPSTRCTRSASARPRPHAPSSRSPTFLSARSWRWTAWPAGSAMMDTD